MKNNIELQNLSKRYKDFELKNISFNVPQGCIVGLIGENGAGKTTTIKSILNITKSEGTIKIFGEDIRKNEKKIKEKIGVVLDDSFLSEYLTTKQINSIMKDIYSTWEENKYIKLLKQFNLPLNKIIKEFSSGMKMKLKIAVAISHNPQILILDEPTSGLDPVVRNEILDIFRKYIEEDETRSILLSSHITTDLEHISDYIIFIEKGNIVFNMPTPELLENYGVIKCSKDDFLKIDSKDYIRYKKGKYQYEVLTNDKNNIRKKYNIETIDKPSIEEIMLFYIKGEK
ncbi:MAG: ABC transporter ATP-binding protein [Clostridium sp.]|nr:ABC transporter ATP-binding protein [Clostridium sp.]